VCNRLLSDAPAAQFKGKAFPSINIAGNESPAEEYHTPPNPPSGSYTQQSGNHPSPEERRNIFSEPSSDSAPPPPDDVLPGAESAEKLVAPKAPTKRGPPQPSRPPRSCRPAPRSRRAS